MSTRIEMMLRGAERAARYDEQSSINRHLLGMIQVLSEEIDAIRDAHRAPLPPMMIDAARAIALADAVRVFLQHWKDPSKLGRCRLDCADGLAEALEKFESGT